MGERISFHEQAMTRPEVIERFGDLHPPFDTQAAVVEANRCLYCFDAPCTSACPTHIDVPRFIKKIATGNLEGSAYTILDANILGGSCARACPVEVLCEGSCVMHRYNKQPIQIARLQRYAMDSLYESGVPLPFEAGPETGWSVALIGAGPASLACAAELRRRGIRADIYDARSLPGGLNSYGVAEYKLPLAESLREIDMLSVLGVNFQFDTWVDAERLAEIERKHDAVFLGIGLGGIHKLGVWGEKLHGVTNALDLIAGYKSGEIASISGRVVVIGAGNTAIDAAIAAVRLGADEVHIVYRRGPDHSVTGIELSRLVTEADGSVVAESGSGFVLDADLIVLSIGQATHTGFLGESGRDGAKVQLERGRVLIDRMSGQTSNPKFFAGGDCTNGGREVVDAVADGKRAGIGIAAWLEAQRGQR
jgi:dihydropyrimidine dehydrogenase (NAD+) subunit PreT